MKVRVGTAFSSIRPINGGSPQGCVSANALFCATIEFLQEGQPEQSAASNEIATLRDLGDGSSLYAGAEILGDIPPDSPTSDEPCVPFSLNGDGVETDEEITDFEPRVSSSPIGNT